MGQQKSELVLHQHHRWAQAMTAIQIAISLAAITLLTRKEWLKRVSFGAAGVGVLLDSGLAAPRRGLNVPRSFRQTGQPQSIDEARGIFGSLDRQPVFQVAEAQSGIQLPETLHRQPRFIHSSRA